MSNANPRQPQAIFSEAMPTIPDLKGKRVLVTGGNNGIGRAAARAFAAQGVHLAIHYGRDADAARSTAAAITQAGQPEPLLFQGDFTDRDATRKTVTTAAEALGGLDILVNNAGTMVARVPIDEADDAEIDRITTLNGDSVVVASKSALPFLRQGIDPAIINVSSISARGGGSAGSALYSAAKGFVSTFTRSLARELAGDGIRVNAVSPGTITTRFHEQYSTPEKLEATRAQIPMKRLGTAEDCAGAFLFLASTWFGGYVTGQVIEVNGGQLMP